MFAVYTFVNIYIYTMVGHVERSQHYQYQLSRSNGAKKKKNARRKRDTRFITAQTHKQTGARRLGFGFVNNIV